eukprot:scaffold2091_cov70-Phaeocystis_antarctica.AAC.1
MQPARFDGGGSLSVVLETKSSLPRGVPLRPRPALPRQSSARVAGKLPPGGRLAGHIGLVFHIGPMVCVSGLTLEP